VFIQGSASHVSAKNLKVPTAPGSLQQAFNTNHPDVDTWFALYEEEYLGLVNHNTFNVISEEEYFTIQDNTGWTATPTMKVFMIKPDADGKPKRAKSRIVVLNNKDPVQ
jgi:hypothetical protein